MLMNLPKEIMIEIFEYDMTKRDNFNKVLDELIKIKIHSGDIPMFTNLKFSGQSFHRLVFYRSSMDVFYDYFVIWKPYIHLVD